MACSTASPKTACSPTGSAFRTERYGTSYRIINLIVGLQLFTIIASRGNVYTLGEAYAFGVIWSFVFKSLAMLVLRFKYKGERGWKVPPNLHHRLASKSRSDWLRSSWCCSPPPS